MSLSPYHRVYATTVTVLCVGLPVYLMLCVWYLSVMPGLLRWVLARGDMTSGWSVMKVGLWICSYTHRDTQSRHARQCDPHGTSRAA